MYLQFKHWLAALICTGGALKSFIFWEIFDKIVFAVINFFFAFLCVCFYHVVAWMSRIFLASYLKVKWLASLTKWLGVSLPTKWLWIWVPLQSFSFFVSAIALNTVFFPLHFNLISTLKIVDIKNFYKILWRAVFIQIRRQRQNMIQNIHYRPLFD